MTTKEKLEQLLEKSRRIELGGGEEALKKVKSTGRLTARERLNRLFDEGTFVELDKFVTHRCTNFGMDKVEIPGEGVVTGYGQVNGRTVFAYAQDFSAVGGSLGEMHAAKICKCLDRAMSAHVPVVGLNDSGGARIQEGVDSLAGYGRIFYKNTMASGIIPQICAIMGPSAGGAVYSPALMDFIFMVKKDYAQMFITGPQVVKATTGEEVTAVELGGALTHNQKSGVAHFMADSDEECIDQIKTLLSYLPASHLEKPPVVPCQDPIDRREEGLLTIVPDQSNRPYDMKKLIKMIVDNGEIFESQRLFAPNMITCFARMDGQTVGIIANQPLYMAGCLDINSSDKAARFIRFCDCFNIPLLTFVDVPGYLPGTQQEFGGIIRHGAKLLYVYPEATVPKITIVIRKAYGGAYLGMCSGQAGADVVMAWPTAEIAVMGAEGAANIIFRKESEEEKKQKIEEYIRNFYTPYQAASRGLVEQVIDPRDTRLYIIKSLKMLANKKEERPWKKHGNIPL
ncbi:MAG TPA: carboxyl transferase domain-containing protein [Syntrophales bacterium]|nr:carboxyl transferase domain-containing protein [Syntrophales bacterium]HOL59474.1 carboxyl transferase domain-containing protein [Syntrophales bacterium]HPO34656.1 carboxyl transferase domain-containing protein [Syntrophales bacterium]